MTGAERVEAILAEQRCCDVHGDTYTAPFCESCRGWAAHVAALVAAETGELAEDPLPRLLSVPDEESMYGLLAALNYGSSPEVPCSAPGGVSFLATLTEPDADHVNYIWSDESGHSRCVVGCENCGTEESAQEDWKPRYPLTVILSQMPDLDRAAEDEIEEANWLRALLVPDLHTWTAGKVAIERDYWKALATSRGNALAAETGGLADALEGCREQRGDLLALVEVEREATRAAGAEALREWCNVLADSVSHGTERGEPWVSWLVGIVKQGRARADALLVPDQQTSEGSER